MTVRRINASEPCARTVASLDDAITVAHTGNSTVLYNLPRDIDALDEAAYNATQDVDDGQEQDAAPGISSALGVEQRGLERLPVGDGHAALRDLLVKVLLGTLRGSLLIVITSRHTILKLYISTVRQVVALGRAPGPGEGGRIIAGDPAAIVFTSGSTGPGTRSSP